MNVQDSMSPSQKFCDFGISIGIQDSSFSFTNQFIVKPIDWLIGKEETKKTTQFICRHLIARIIGSAASAFAMLDVTFNLLLALSKLPLAPLKKLGVKQIPSSCSFQGIISNIKNFGQAVFLTATASFLGIARPDLLGPIAYPLSEKNSTPLFGYHEISKNITNPWTISPQLFKKQLERLYQNNYELCTMKELLEGYKPSKEKKLAVITFDDSHESQFRVFSKEKGTDLDIDPTSAMGIMEKIRQKHPDFRCVATFFVNTSNDKGSSGKKDHQLFADDPKQKEFTVFKLKYLLDNGYEIASHGHFHTPFSKLSKEDIQKDIENFDQAIDAIKQDAKSQGISLEDLKIDSFAWPHGAIPSKSKRALIDEHFKYIADFGLNAKKLNTTHIKDFKRIPRIYIGPNTGFEKYIPKNSKSFF